MRTENTLNTDTLIDMETAKRGRNRVWSTQVLIPDSLSAQAVHPERMADLTSSLAVRSPADTKSPTGQEGQPHHPSIENESHVIIMIRW